MSLYLISIKVPGIDLVLMSLTEDETAVSSSSGHVKADLFAGEKRFPQFSVILRPLVLVRFQAIEPASSRSAVKRCIALFPLFFTLCMLFCLFHNRSRGLATIKERT